MARPRQFDEERAVRAAMRAFWTTGYEATSTQDLCEATGLGRSSIYNTFTSKRALFDKALRCYMADMEAALADLLDGDSPIREKIRAVLWRAVRPDPGDPEGCLVVNSLIELAARDPQVAMRLRAHRARQQEMLRAAFEAAIRAGQIDAGKDAGALAHFVTATVGGMRVAARGGADRAELEAIATTALDAI